VTYEPADAALAAYRLGRPDDAVAAADRAIAADPFAAEAHLIKLLLALRRHQPAEAVESLRKCLASRPPEWVVERMRQDFNAHGMPALTRDVALKVGGILRSHLGALGPAIPADARRARHEFINVVGSSYVRSFGGHPAFFPLFIGMGPTMLLLNDEQAAVTRRKFAENLKRVDLTRNTLLIAGSDPYYYAVNLQKAGVTRGAEATAEDLAEMDAVAERHRAILADAKAMIVGRPMLLGLTPTFSDHMNQLCRYLNDRLRPICEAEGVLFLDWWDELADPATGHLRDDYAAKAYPGDIHFSLSCTQRFMELLKADGHFSDAVVPGGDYEWSHVFEVNVEASEKTRIWCEPSVTPRNAFQSNKVASAHLAGHTADLLTTLLARVPDRTLAMVNVRDGYLPAAVPRQVAMGCLAFTDTAENLQVAQQVLDFYGRLDVRLSGAGDLDLLDGQTFSHLVLLIHPDTLEADEQRCNEALRRVAAAPTVLIGTPRPDRLSLLNLGGRVAKPMNISNRLIPEQWREYSVAMVEG
jgi:hypothetical protein